MKLCHRSFNESIELDETPFPAPRSHPPTHPPTHVVCLLVRAPPREYREFSPSVRLGMAQLRAVLAACDTDEHARNLREQAGFNARSDQVCVPPV